VAEQSKVLQIDLNQRFDYRVCVLVFEEQLLTTIFRREHQEVAIVSSDPLAGSHQSSRRRVEMLLNCLWQAEKLESQHQVVSPQEHLHWTDR